MNAALRIGIGLAFSMLLMYVVTALRGPQGIPWLMKKQEEIRALQEENARLAQENNAMKEQNEALRTSRAAQELAVKEYTGRTKKGEATIVVPTPPEPDESTPDESNIAK